MLGLLTPTHPDWVRVAIGQLDALLCDHAHCELKAAHHALSLIGRFGGEAPSIVPKLVALAQEETTHFEQVHQHLARRDIPFRGLGSDHYAVRLREEAKRTRGDRPVLLDRLMVAALIEARSAERFSLIAKHLTDPELKEWYGDLLASEAGHYRLFIDMASELFGIEATRNRYRELAEREAQVLQELPMKPVMHG
jgi:tRNA-(ms[2]io[6]A)-hydroxylase